MDANTQVAYKIGEVYLVNCGYNGLQEVEILDVCKAAKSIDTDRDGWVDAAGFHERVLGRLGHMETEGWWPLRRRVLVRD